MKIESIEIGKIFPNPKNPRKISESQLEKLAKSLKKFPKMLSLRPIVIDKKGMILGGNQRFEAAKKIGLKSVPVIRADSFTKDQLNEFIIRDNVPFGEWAWDILDELSKLGEIDLSVLDDWGLKIPYLGHEKNSMSESDLDMEEKFDAIGTSKGLQRVVFIFDDSKAADKYLKKLGKITVKKFNNAWHVNLSSQST